LSLHKLAGGISQAEDGRRPLRDADRKPERLVIKLALLAAPPPPMVGMSSS